VFVGTFTTTDLEVNVVDGHLRIGREGSDSKFVQQVEHRTFSGREAIARGQSVLYVTERCVFRLAGTVDNPHLELVEIAPGVDLQRDVLAHMAFVPAISPHLMLMDSALFQPQKLDLRDRMLATPLSERLELDMEHCLLFINFEGLAIDRAEDIVTIEAHVCELLDPMAVQGKRVAVVANYDNFNIVAPLIENYVAMVQRLSERYYTRVTRYGAVGFLKAKLEDRNAGE
jgi:propionate CoA-transferase